MTQTFSLPVQPVAKGRPRVVRLKNGASHSFTPDKTVDAEERIRWHLREQGAVLYPAGVALDVTMVFHCPRPKTLPKKVTHNVKRADLDQYCKLLMDALNGIVYPDDAQVVTIRARKVYAEGEPYIYLYIREEDGE